MASHTNGGVFAWFAGNPVSANLMMAFMLIGGLLMANTLNAQTFPDIDPRLITVSVTYPGATPEEMEDAVARRVEEALIGIDGVARVRSSATEGSGVVSVELKDFANAQSVKDDVETAVDQLADFPPEDAEQPRVVISEAAADVMQLAVYGAVSELALRAAAERVENDLLRLDDVSLVNLQGVRDREISIEVSEASLRRYGLSLEQVAAAVRTASLDLSGGTLRTRGGDILLRTDAERKTGAAFADIVVASDPTGRRLLLGDIATIVDAFEDDELINTFRDRPAVFIEIGRSDDQDAFDVSSAVLGLLEAYTPPDGVVVEVVSDTTTVIADRLNLLIRNAVLGLALVFLFLTVTLDLRLAFWTTVGIPIAFFGAFLIFGQFVAISMPMLFGLIIVLGVVVDDAIVVGENIFEEQQRTGAGMAGAIAGARGVVAPVTIGVLTTMAAFAPLLFSTGALGQILFPVPVVVIAVLAMSLLEAFFILPAHLSHAADWSAGPMARLKVAGQGVLASFRDRLIMPVVTVATRARYVTLALAMAMILVTGGVLASGELRFVFFPAVEADQVSVTLEMREGTAFERTQAAMDRVTAAGLEAVGGDGAPVYESMSVTIGGLLGGGFSAPETANRRELAANVAEATLVLAPAAERAVSSEEIARRWRDAVGDIPGVRALTFSSSLVGGGADVSLDLVHPDDGRLAETAEHIAALLRGVPGVGEIDTGLDGGKRQVEFELTAAGAAAGLTTQDIARQVRQAFFGEEVQRIQRGREEVRVYVRYPASERTSLADLERLRIRLAGGGEAPLGVVAQISESVSPTTIDRVGGRRIITLEADVDEAVTTPNIVNALLAEQILPDLAQRDPQLDYAFEGQSRDQAEDLAALRNNLLISLGVIFVMLASVLRSYTKPLIIMAAIPLAAVSAIWGHLIMGYDLSFLSLFGIVALTGVVINDSVVMLDYYNTVRARENVDAYTGILLAVRRRFRPILLTTLTTFIGLLPMLAETSLQAQFLIPMAISLGFGILFAGFMILAFVPALVMVGEDVGSLPRRVRRRWVRRRRVAAPGAP